MKFYIWSESEQGYWSNDQGWVDFPVDATAFDNTEGTLPLSGPVLDTTDATWVVVADFEMMAAQP